MRLEMAGADARMLGVNSIWIERTPLAMAGPCDMSWCLPDDANAPERDEIIRLDSLAVLDGPFRGDDERGELNRRGEDIEWDTFSLA